MGYFEKLSEPLSDEGQARKGRILAVIQADVTRRRHMRRISAWGMVSLPVLFWALWPSRVPPPVPDPAVSRPAYAFTQIIRTDPSMRDRFSIAPAPPMAEVVKHTCNLQNYLIDDRALSQLLAEAGKPPGVFRLGGCVLLAMDFEKPRRE